MLKAADIAPDVFGDVPEDELEYDLGNLLASHTAPLDETTLVKGKREASMLKLSTHNTQQLIAKLFRLPATITEAGPTVGLPAPKLLLPRSKPVPRPKELTTWEKFAAEKGIKNVKKSRMVYDEAKNEWLPRWGYGKANDEMAQWAIPVGGNDDPYQDPFEKLAVEKKERVIKNKLNQLENLAKAAKARGESKEMKAARLAVVQRSTASMGEFDRKLRGEPEKKKRPQKRLPGESVDVDHDRNLSVLRKVLGKHGAADVEGELLDVGAGSGAGAGSDAGAGEGGKPGGAGGPSKKKRRGVHSKKGGKPLKGKGGKNRAPR